MRLLIPLVLLIAFAAPEVACGAVVYRLFGQVAEEHEATGTITTDGTLGVLTTANIVSSSITVTDPANHFLLLSDPVTFSGVSATQTELIFDGTGEVLFNNGADTTHFRLRNLGFRTIRTIANGGRRGDFTAPHTFAVSVPEPSGLLPCLMLLTGLVIRRTRRISLLR